MFPCGQKGKILTQNCQKSPFKPQKSGFPPVSQPRISSVNTMERRVSCLKRKSRNSWSWDRLVSLASKVWLVQDLSLEMPHFLWGSPFILSPNSIFILVFQGAAFLSWSTLDLVYRFQNITDCSGIVHFPCPQCPADLQMSSSKIYSAIIIYEY